MAKNLVIVESPAKAKTIEGYLGKDFIVKSSYGHIRDLASKNDAIDVENNFEPNYVISSDKKTIVADLKKSVKACDTVWLATDEDREGEAISWHLYEALKLDKKDTKRITFNEITKSAITKAIESPRKIDTELVNAQQARRILDRLVGFELSPVLWRKVKPSLSAGRVQSVSVRLIVEREREILGFDPKSSFKVRGDFNLNGKSVQADLKKNVASHSDANSLLESFKGKDFKITDVQKKPGKKSPTSPFITSTLQQEASLKLGFSVSKTMVVAQRLYEAGHITYMRTDSVNLSEHAMTGIQKEIEKSYGKEFSNPKKYKSKDGSAQEAHEAIRPTEFANHTVKAENDEVRLYELIWKRTVASQMTDAKIERTIIDISCDNENIFVAKGEVITFEGFLKVYLESKIDEDDEEDVKGLLPKVNIGEDASPELITATERFSKPAPRYAEASLVKKLEELGIGRPSTYAPTISTIQKRGYVLKEEREGKKREYQFLELKGADLKTESRTEIWGADRNKLYPSDIGMVVNDFLTEHFETILDYNFTASVEKQFDDIAQGLMEWTEMIRSFYTPFHAKVEETLESADRASGERHLGVHPESGKDIIVRIGRFGPMAQIGKAVEGSDEKPQFSSLRKNQSIATITLEDALDLFKLPRTLGEFEDKIVKANIGRFGPYVQHNSKFVSIKEEDGDPMTIELDKAIELIKQKRIDDAAKIIKLFPEDESFQLLIGRWGPYLKIGKENFKLPKDCEPEKLTLEECIHISENQPAKKGRGAKKKAPAKKATAKKKAPAKKKTTAKKK